jgi:hypothetical protein
MPQHRVGFTSFPLSQDELAVSASSSSNSSSYRLPSRAETKASNRTTVIGYPPRTFQLPPLHCCKKSISILATLLTTQSCLHLTSFLARAPCYQSSTHHHCSLSPLSQVHRPFAQWHPRWQTSQPFFASWITYRHVNSHKKIFWNTAASCGVIN